MKQLIILLLFSQFLYGQVDDQDFLDVSGDLVINGITGSVTLSSDISEHYVMGWGDPVHISKLYSKYAWLPTALEKQQQRGELQRVVLFEGVTPSKRDAIHFSFADPYNDQILMNYVESGRVICGNGYCSFYLLRWPGGAEYSIDSTLEQDDPIELHYDIIAKNLTEGQMITIATLSMDLNFGFVIDEEIDTIPVSSGLGVLYDQYPWLEAHVYKFGRLQGLELQSITVYPNMFYDWHARSYTLDGFLYEFESEADNMLIKEGGGFANTGQKNIDRYYKDRLVNGTVYTQSGTDKITTITKFKATIFNVPLSKYLGHYDIEFRAGKMKDIEIKVIDPKDK